MCEVGSSKTSSSFDWTLNRRQFVGAGASVGIAGCSSSAVGRESALSEGTVRIATADGTMDAFFVRPASGHHPAVLMWPDVAGLREAFGIMARRLAGLGYAVLVANPYYRVKPAPQFKDFATFSSNNGFEIVKPWRDALTPKAVSADAAAAIRWLDARPEVDTTRDAVTNGYCMGGPFAIETAAAAPDRVRAAATLHGASLVRPDDVLSPHKMLGRTRASYLFAIAQNDDGKSPSDKDELKLAAAAAHVAAKIEVFPADHGWTVIDSPAYDRTAAELAWAEMTTLFAAVVRDAK